MQQMFSRYRSRFDPASLISSFSSLVSDKGIAVTDEIKSSGENVSTTSPNLFIAIVDRVAEVLGRPKREIVMEANALGLNVESEIKALMVARKYEIFIENLIDPVEKELIRRYSGEH